MTPTPQGSLRGFAALLTGLTIFVAVILELPWQAFLFGFLAGLAVGICSQ